MAAPARGMSLVYLPPDCLRSNLALAGSRRGDDNPSTLAGSVHQSPCAGGRHRDLASSSSSLSRAASHRAPLLKWQTAFNAHRNAMTSWCVSSIRRENVPPIEQVPADPSLQYRCEPAGRLSVCGVSTGEEDFKSTRLAKFHRNSNTLVLAEGQYEEFVVSRIGFAGQCASLPTARPLYMASELSAEQLLMFLPRPTRSIVIPIC